MHSGKLLRLHQWRTPKTHALRFRHGDALRLPLPDAPPVEEPDVVGAYLATVGGGSVNVRNGRGTAHPVLGIAHAGERLLAMPAEAGWCEVAAALRGTLTKGYMAERYVRREG